MINEERIFTSVQQAADSVGVPAKQVGDCLANGYRLEGHWELCRFISTEEFDVGLKNLLIL